MSDIGNRAERLAWIASGIGLAFAILGLLLGAQAKAVSMSPACLSGLVVMVLALVSGTRCRLARRQVDEELQVEEYRRTHARTDLFEGDDEAVKLAARANEHFVKYVVPGATVLVGAAIIVGGWLLWSAWSGDTGDLQKAALPLRHAALALGLFLGGVVSGSYYIGVSREPGCRWVRPVGAWLMFTALLFLLGALALIGEHMELELPRFDLRMAQLGIALLALLGAEMAVNFVIEFYRPRTTGDVERPLFESRILALFTEPGGMARNMAAALDYQFGFQVSEVWFYRFLERTLLPFAVVMVAGIWLQTCIVVVNTEEQGIREFFGQVRDRTALSPGIYLKLPAPFARITTFPVERVQEIPIGYVPAKPGEPPPEMDPEMEGDPSGRVIVWSRTHHVEELDFIVATRQDHVEADLASMSAREALPVTVAFMSASIPLYFKVNDLYQYAYAHRNPLQALEALATREVVSYLASVDFFTMLTKGRAEGGEILRQRIQAAADEKGLGIDVVFVGLQGLHPPVSVGAAFDEVVAAVEEMHTEVLNAEQYAIRREPEAEGAAVALVSAAEGYRQERTGVAAAEAERFAKQRLGFDLSPSLFVLGTFLDVLENEGGNARKYVVAAQKSTEVFILNLEEKLRPDLLDLDFER